jgi:hypothetical protein
MDRAWLNDMAKRAKLNRINPADVLKQFRPLAVGADPKVKGLRTAKLKRRREIVEASLFCYGLSCRTERPVWVIDHEGADYDLVATWENNGDNYLAPTQLKEVIQKRVNPEASVQSVIDGLAKYPVSTGLTVAIRVNQEGMLDLDEITIPPLPIAALWIYGSMSQDGSRWFLSGNLLQPEPDEGWIFDYPA